MAAHTFHYLLLLLCACCLFTPVYSQIKISGLVTNKQQAAIPGASVTLKGSSNGSTTDSAGRFVLSTSLKGKQTLSVSSIGYKTTEKMVMIADSSISVHVILPADQKTLGEVVISAGSFEASDKAKGASLTPIDAVTVAGTGADLSNSFRSLPGAQMIGEREGLFVRGGSGEETKQFVDGTLLRNPNYPSVPGIIQPARLNPFLFKGILFSTGGYSAQYGQAMSSALILESVDLPDVSSAGFNLFPQNIGLGIQQLGKKKKSSYGLNIDYTNLSPYNSIVPQKPDYFTGPEYGRAQANFRVKTSKTGMLKLYASATLSNVGLRNPDIDSAVLQNSFQLNSRNLYANISYREMLGQDWQLTAGAAYSYNQEKVTTALENSAHATVSLPSPPFYRKNMRYNTGSNFAQGRVVLTRLFSRKQALHIGIEHFYTNDRLRSNDSIYPLTDQFSAAFAESDIYITPNMMARAGVRVEHSVLLQQSTVAPRASLAYRFNDGGQINVAYGLFYQKPENIYLFQQRNLHFSRADHYIANYTRKAGNRLLRLEAYYKKYHQLVKTLPEISNKGGGNAKGIELFWRDKRSIRGLDYWITYTYLHTQRDYLNFPYALQPGFATPHTAAVVVKRYFQDLNLNINLAYNFATGRPYYDIRAVDGAHAQIYDQGTTKAYHNLNLSGAYMFSIFPKWKRKDYSGIGFGVNNILGNRQVFGYQYSYNGFNKVPVVPPATRAYYIGIFMSFGIDRSEDFINNNL
jgi:hypothetical protein